MRATSALLMGAKNYDMPRCTKTMGVYELPKKRLFGYSRRNALLHALWRVTGILGSTQCLGKKSVTKRRGAMSTCLIVSADDASHHALRRAEEKKIERRPVLIVGANAEELAATLEAGEVISVSGKLAYKAGRTKDSSKLVVVCYGVERLVASPAPVESTN
jgi:hypothetical protein